MRFLEAFKNLRHDSQKNEPQRNDPQKNDLQKKIRKKMTREEKLRRELGLDRAPLSGAADVQKAGGREVGDDFVV